MKTGEEKFDDEIRQKLRYSEVKPPEGFFDVIVPSKEDKKRGFIWIWLSGIFILIATIISVQFFTGNTVFMHHKINAPGDKNLLNNSVQQKGEELPAHSQTESGFKNNSSDLKPESESSQSASQNSNSGNSDNSSLKSTEGNAENKDLKSSSENANLKTAADNSTMRNSDELNGSEKRKSRNTTGIAVSVRKTKENEQTANLNENSFAGKSFNRSDGTNYNYDILYSPVPALPYENHQDIKQQIRIIKPDDRPLQSHKPTPFSLEFSLSYLNFNNKMTPSVKDTFALRLFETGKSSWSNKGSWGANMRLLYFINERFQVNAGFGYAKRDESFQTSIASYHHQLKIDSISYYILFPFIPPMLITKSDTTDIITTQLHDISHQLTFHTFNFTAGAGYSIPFGAFNLEPGAGVCIDFFTKIKGTSNFNQDFAAINGSDYYKNNLQLAVYGMIQLGYALSEKTNLFINSGYQYNFTSLETKPAFYENKLNNLSFGCGIRYSIFKRQAAKSIPGGSGIVKQ